MIILPAMAKEEVKESNTSRARTAGQQHMERTAGIVFLSHDKIIRQYQQICNTPQLKGR